VDLRRAELRGSPESVDLLQQPAPSVAPLRGGGPRVIKAIELHADARDGRHHRSSTGFRRMSGEHRLHAEAGEHVAEPLRSVDLMDLGDRRRQRLWRWA
jgi:hypothetical protein